LADGEPVRTPEIELSEYDALVSAAASVLDAIPGAVYLCDSEGWLVRYNSEAAELWGRRPKLEEGERFCGSHRLFLPDGTPLPHSDCPMADAVRTGAPTRSKEVVIERPDGTRITALVNIQALHGHDGKIQGAINCFQDITAHKQLEAEVLRKNEDLEDFFENAAIGLHIVDSNGIIVRANRAELDMLGYEADEYVGRSITDFHVDDQVIGDILGRLSCGEKLDHYPARLRAKDGSVRHVLITSNSRFRAAKFINTRCFTTDITPLRDAENARRDSDDRLAATYEAAMVGIAEVDEAGRYVRVNDASCAILGYSREEIIGRSMFEIIHPDDRAREEACYRRQVSGETGSYTIEKRARRSDGSLAYLEVVSSSVRDQDGRFRYAVRVMQDVTERKRMQEEIEASERRFRELLGALPAAVYTTDQDGRVTFFNQAALEFAGRKPEIGDDQWCITARLFCPDGTPLPHEQCPMAMALKENRTISGAEAVAERPDGTRVPFLAYPTPLRDSEGKVVGAVNMLVDISARKQAEARQRTLIDELNHRVKNTLATVQSMAMQTARHAADLQDFSASFEARLLALAKAHDLLTKRNWSGVDMASLVGDVVGPLSGVDGQLRVGGHALVLNSRAALSLTMVLNELATNAAKYGALSRGGGNLTIEWDVTSDNGQELVLTWIEVGGPAVVPPKRRGFGTRVIERCVERDLDGQIELDYDPAGLRAKMTFPMQAVLADD
jgi:PAS domain S-box-containing protein